MIGSRTHLTLANHEVAFQLSVSSLCRQLSISNTPLQSYFVVLARVSTILAKQ